MYFFIYFFRFCLFSLQICCFFVRTFERSSLQLQNLYLSRSLYIYIYIIRGDDSIDRSCEYRGAWSLFFISWSLFVCLFLGNLIFFSRIRLISSWSAVGFVFGIEYDVSSFRYEGQFGDLNMVFFFGSIFCGDCWFFRSDWIWINGFEQRAWNEFLNVVIWWGFLVDGAEMEI